MYEHINVCIFPDQPSLDQNKMPYYMHLHNCCHNHLYIVDCCYQSGKIRSLKGTHFQGHFITAAYDTKTTSVKEQQNKRLLSRAPRPLVGPPKTISIWSLVFVRPVANTYQNTVSSGLSDA